ncbi:hypothetical protein sos41_03390 [Alphaproteobacteria bacterium SO-S41]|nr:hypothetical protein sos41_03390 [Alphaproteobacteria bacterium SO-S41]
MKIFPHIRPRVPLSDRVWGAIFGTALIGWAVLFSYGAVVTHIA